MAVGELLEPQDIMFTDFEPKLKNRFIMNIYFYSFTIEKIKNFSPLVSLYWIKM